MDDSQREGWVFVLRGVHEAEVHASSQTPFLVLLLFSSPCSLYFYFALSQSPWEQRERRLQTCLHPLSLHICQTSVHRHTCPLQPGLRASHSCHPPSATLGVCGLGPVGRARWPPDPLTLQASSTL